MGALVLVLCSTQRFDKVSYCIVDCEGGTSGVFFVVCSDKDICSFLQGKFVAEAMTVIAANTDVPVSVKCRIGVDDHDSYNELCKVLFC